MSPVGYVQVRSKLASLNTVLAILELMTVSGYDSIKYSAIMYGTYVNNVQVLDTDEPWRFVFFTRCELFARIRHILVCVKYTYDQF